MNFYQKAYQITKKIPKGRVATYGQIASLAGSPRSARIVGYALSILPACSKVPWHRVINSRGEVSIENLAVPKEVQVRLLRSEGVKVKKISAIYLVDLKIYLWKHICNQKNKKFYFFDKNHTS